MQNPKCSRCGRHKALTKCVKGSLCQLCGNQCHQRFQHPVEFITHTPLEDSQLSKRPAMKSMVLLSSKNIGSPPVRMSKIGSKRQLKMFGQQFKMTLQKQKKDQVKHKETSSRVRVQNSLRSSKKSLQISKKMSEIDTISAVKSYNQTVQIVQSGEETLRKKVKQQQKVIELLKNKLQKQMQNNKKIHEDYRQRLQLIRKMRA